jgi:hypothetical protein
LQGENAMTGDPITCEQCMRGMLSGNNSWSNSWSWMDEYEVRKKMLEDQQRGTNMQQHLEEEVLIDKIEQAVSDLNGLLVQASNLKIEMCIDVVDVTSFSDSVKLHKISIGDFHRKTWF